MKNKGKQLAQQLNISEARASVAIAKAKLIGEILRIMDGLNMTHAELAKASGLSRSSVTGILSGSLQKVTLDRIVRLVEAFGMTVQISDKKAA